MSTPRTRRPLTKNWIIIVVLLGFVLSIPLALLIDEIDTSTFFGLYIPALLGILGSYGLYLQRQRDRRGSLRQSLMKEIEGMHLLQHWPPEGNKSIPSVDVITMTIYESNSNDFGLLNENELESIVGFYTRAKHVREALQYHGELNIRYDTSVIGTDINKLDRKKSIMNLIDSLAIRRHYLLYLFEQTTDGASGEPLSEGMVLDQSHPIVKRNPRILVRYDLLHELNEDQERYTVTEMGESFFEGELDTSDLEPIDYTLGGVDEFLQYTLPRKLRSLVVSFIRFLIRYKKDLVKE